MNVENNTTNTATVKLNPQRFIICEVVSKNLKYRYRGLGNTIKEAVVGLPDWAKDQHLSPKKLWYGDIYRVTPEGSTFLGSAKLGRDEVYVYPVEMTADKPEERDFGLRQKVVLLSWFLETRIKAFLGIKDDDDSLDDEENA